MATEQTNGQEDDGGMGRLLRERLTRHPAPPMLRATVREALEPRTAQQPWGMLWGAPAAAAIATALVMLLWIAPSLPSAPATDPAQLVVRAVLADHARNIFWGESRTDVVPAALPRAMAESGVALNSVFTAHDHLPLFTPKPTYLEERPG